MQESIIISILKKIDFVGERYKLEYKGSNIHKTVEGGIFSSIIFSVILILSILFGKEIFQKNVPILFFQDEFINESKVYLQDYPFLFLLYGYNGKNIAHFNDYFDYTIYIVDVDEIGFVTFKPANNTLVECKHYKFRNNDKVVKDYMADSVNDFYCINDTQNNYFKNTFPKKNSSALQLSISFCNSSLPERNCKADEAFFNKQPLLNLYFLTNYMQTSSFSEPIVPRFTNFAQTVSRD